MSTAAPRAQSAAHPGLGCNLHLVQNTHMACIYFAPDKRQSLSEAARRLLTHVLYVRKRNPASLRIPQHPATSCSMPCLHKSSIYFVVRAKPTRDVRASGAWHALF